MQKQLTSEVTMDRSDVLAHVAALAEKWAEPEEKERRDCVRRDWPELAFALDRLNDALRPEAGEGTCGSSESGT